jgi:hypothetical protein
MFLTGLFIVALFLKRFSISHVNLMSLNVFGIINVNRQLKKENPEKLTTYGTQYEDKLTKISTQYVLDTQLCANKRH